MFQVWLGVYCKTELTVLVVANLLLNLSAKEL